MGGFGWFLVGFGTCLGLSLVVIACLYGWFLVRGSFRG
jgi:hypothetical protein